MRNLEKQINAIISQLNRTALLRVMQTILNKLQEEELDEYGVTQTQWMQMEESIEKYKKGELETISRAELEKRVKELRANRK